VVVFGSRGASSDGKLVVPVFGAPSGPGGPVVAGPPPGALAVVVVVAVLLGCPPGAAGWPGDVVVACPADVGCVNPGSLAAGAEVVLVTTEDDVVDPPLSSGSARELSPDEPQAAASAMNRTRADFFTTPA
jgi:hypothetical protein